jgi:hypothetical protein
VLDKEAYLLGAFARAEVAGATTLGLRYQREIWSDRSGLISERASLDAVTSRLLPLQVEGALDWDAGFGRLGKSHLTLRYPLPAELAAGVVLEGTVRRYVPYFELSTIWGFFSPVPYHEALLRARAPLPLGTTVQVAGGWRRYGETNTPVAFTPLTDDGWRAELEVLTPLGEALDLEGRYQIEWGVGAFLSSVEARARWRPAGGFELGALATAFQQFQEFRVGDGRVWGAGVLGGAALPGAARLDGGLALYRHDRRGGAVSEAWNQLRAWTSLTVPFGNAAGEVPRRWRR